MIRSIVKSIVVRGMPLGRHTDLVAADKPVWAPHTAEAGGKPAWVLRIEAARK